MKASNELTLGMIAKAVDGTAVVGRWGHKDGWFATATSDIGEQHEVEAGTSDGAIKSLNVLVRDKLLAQQRKIESDNVSIAEALACLPDNNHCDGSDSA